jgi:hypothetical protein
VLVLIDESGDPGFKLVRGSSSHFVVAMAIFEDAAEAERASRAIGEARGRLRVKPEFKFTRSHDQVRDGFFQVACGFRFRLRALVVDKSALYSAHLRENTDRFYNYFVQLLLRNDHGALREASIKIDGSGDREFKRELDTYLRRQLEPGRVRKLRFVDSHSDNLVQLADMCAGAVLRAYRSDDKRNPRWLDMLRRARRIDDLWEFP